MKYDRPSPKVTVEDLLRLKRAERPPAEFWAKFESDLRAKQLAAIVDRHPWWHAMPRVFKGIARQHLPVGATAIMAMTIFAIGGYQVASVDHPAPAISPAPMLVNDEVPATAQVVAMSSIPAPTTEMAAEHLAHSGEISSVAALSQSASLTGEPDQTPAHSARAIIDRNLEKSLTETQHLAMDELPTGITRAFETRTARARLNSEPLAQVRTPMDDRRERYLGRSLPGDYAVEASSFHPASRSSETLNRRYNERRFHESDEISRFGAHGAGVSIKL